MGRSPANVTPKVADVTGKVRNLTNYGAFIELEEGIDGLLHVSDMSWTRKISHPSEMLEKGQEIRVPRAERRRRTPPHRTGSEAARQRSVGWRHS